MGYGVSGLDPYEGYSEFSHMGRNYGNPLVNMLMSVGLGSNYMPQSPTGQSYYDSFIARSRTQNMMGLQSSAFANNMLATNMGMQNNPFSGILGAMGASPDSMIGKVMSPMLGGNPMASSMQIYSKMAGANVMGTFGRLGSISPGETMQVMNALGNNIYKKQSFEGPGGSKGEYNRRIQDHVLAEAEKGGKGLEYARDLGFNIPADASGNITPAGRAAIKGMDFYEEGGEASRKMRDKISARQIAAFDIESALPGLTEANKAKPAPLKAGEVDTEDARINREKAEAKVAEAEKKITTLLSDKLKLSDEEITNLKTAGRIDAKKVATHASRLTNLTPDERIFMEGKAAQEAGSTTTGFNFINSRGFKLEDFTSAFAKGSELRMLGNQKNMSPAASMADFSKYGGGAMSAARGLVGNKSGEELMSFMNDFAGRSNVSLGSEKGAGEMEALLRKTKATASVAGVGIKTMLEIIKATHDLAASNPQLQYMNATAHTEMALKAVGNAAISGAQMSSEEYRAAGGDRGLATRDITEKQSYAQSSLAGFKASLRYMAAPMDEKVREKVDQILAEAHTGRDLNQAVEKVARVTGKSYSEVYTRGNSSVMQREALARPDIAEKTYNEADKSIVASFYEGGKRFGLNEAKIKKDFAAYMANNGNLEDFRSTLIGSLDSQGQETYTQYRGTIDRDLMESLRGPEDRKKYDAMVSRQVELETALDKKFAGKNAPVSTQILDVMMSGKGLGSKETADALAGIFATSDSDSSGVKQIMKSAEDAGAKIAELTTVSTGNDDIKKRGLSGEINKITEARRAQMLARGDTSGAAKLFKIDDADLDKVAVLKSIKGASPEKFKKMLDTFRQEKSANTLTEGNARLLEGLEVLEKTGNIDSASAIGRIQQGDLKAFAAGTIQAKVDYDVKAYTHDKKALVTQHMGDRLAENAKLTKGNEISKAMQQKEYREPGGKVNWEKMLEDYNTRGSGKNTYFDRMSEDQFKKVAKSTLGAGLSQMQDSRNVVDQTAAAEKAAQNPMADATKAMQDLTEAINSGGAVGTALTALALVLK